MKLLVLGGTRFLGRHVVDAALERGDEVTLFHRGQSGPELYPEVERRLGDRDGGLDALRGGSWDAVIDTSGYVPRLVGDSARRLADAAGHYVFVSSLSVYADFSKPGFDERTPVIELADPATEEIDGPEAYGGLKALCERAAESAMPGRVASVRAGLIVGPFDPSDRYPYWVRRLAAGGRVLAPGEPERPAQLVDARDLARFLLHLGETRTAGSFNATGATLPFGELLARTAAGTGTGAELELVWVAGDFLVECGVEPFTELPLWIPGAEHAGFLQADSSRARAAGLTTRPLEETAAAAWAFERERDPREGSPALKREREAELLAAWAAKG